jgi:hypothetical protein
VRFPFQFQAPTDDAPHELALHLWQRIDATPPAGASH